MNTAATINLNNGIKSSNNSGKNMFCCPECGKVYKAKKTSTNVKCSLCSCTLINTKVSEERYAILSPAQKQAIKNKFTKPAPVEEESIEFDYSKLATISDDNSDTRMTTYYENDSVVKEPVSKSFFDDCPVDNSIQIMNFDNKINYEIAEAKAREYANLRRPFNDIYNAYVDPNVRTSNIISYLWCYLYLIYLFFESVLQPTGINISSNFILAVYLIMLIIDTHSLRQMGIEIGWGWRIGGLFIPALYLFEKFKELGQGKGLAILSLMIQSVFIILAIQKIRMGI